MATITATPVTGAHTMQATAAQYNKIVTDLNAINDEMGGVLSDVQEELATALAEVDVAVASVADIAGEINFSKMVLVQDDFDTFWQSNTGDPRYCGSDSQWLGMVGGGSAAGFASAGVGTSAVQFNPQGEYVTTLYKGAPFVMGAGPIVVEARTKLSASKGSGSGTLVSVGLGSNPTSFTYPWSPNGVVFNYMDGATWDIYARARSNTSNETTVDTTVDASTTYVTLRLEINAAGTEAKFYVNGTLRATITTNLPTGTLYLHASQYGWSGANEKLTIDWLKCKQTLTTPR
jgi:hypothetical protein